jgi:cell wall-associated NlpC family hydrolase
VEPHASVVAEARTWLGIPYVYGGQSRQGIDCSGLVIEVYRAVGRPICDDDTAEGLRSRGAHRAWGQVHDGDLLFFDTEATGEAGHVAIKISSSEMIHAPQPGDVVRVSNFRTAYWQDRIIEARCYL